MNRRFFQQLCALAAFAGASLLAGPVLAADEAAEGLIKRLSTEVLDSIRADKAIQAGDVNRIIALVDNRIMPNVNFQRMTASAVGPGWRQATPEQQKRLQEEFKTLLVRTYAGALTQGPSGPNISHSGAPRVGMGVGISWRSPFGLINIDLAKAVAKQPYDVTQIFRFGFGTRF